MMKKFVTIVLHGLVSLSKESPIWAKEHHRPLKKDTRKKRRAAKRAKAVGRRSLVRAVGISPLVYHLDHFCLRCYCPVVYVVTWSAGFVYIYCSGVVYVGL